LFRRRNIMIRMLAIASVITATALGSLPGDVAAAEKGPAERSSKFMSRTGRPGEFVTEGNIVWSNREATKLRLDNGTELTVPSSVPVMPTRLVARRSIKAYYVNEGGEHVITMIELRGAQPGTGSDEGAG
jgi:hypothetical protein